MAELNFGLLTPPGSQSIGNAFAQGMDQAAVARAQENQNALAQYTLSKARREDEQQNKLYQAVQDPNFKLDVRTALQYGPQGMAALKAQQEAAVAEQTRALNQSQIAERQARLPGYVAEAFDKQMKPFSSAAYNSKNVGEGIASINAMYDNLALASVLTKIKSREQAIESTVAAFSDPKTMAQWQAYWGGITPDKLYTQATVSANTQATLAQAQQHFDGLSAYQKEQLRRQGKQFDSDRGGIVDLNTGTFEPVYLYPSSTPPAPAAPAAPAAIPTAPIAAPAGTPITQPRVATAGTFPRVTTVQQTNRMEGATAIRRQELANEQNALENARQKLASPAAANDPDIRKFYEERAREATNNINALNKELGNQPAQPSATQPAQRTVLGPKTETPTITQIVDPSNPNQMITIDARRYTGGGSGSAGVIGVSGKEPSAALRENKAEAGKTLLADEISNVRNSLNILNANRAIPSTERGSLSNISSSIAASGVGQLTGRIVGTEAQTERDLIASSKLRLSNAIKQASGMTAAQLNSNVELQTMLKSISDPAQSIETNLRNLDNIEKAYVNVTPPVRPSTPTGASLPAPTAPVDMPSAARAEIARRAAAKR